MNKTCKGLTLLCAAALLSGCATMDDQQRTRGEGAAAGALIGGLLGYAIDRERGAAVGALLGGGVGLAVGNEIAKRKQAYASTEDFLDGEIARVAEFNTTTVAYNQRLSGEIAQLETESSNLRARFDAGSADRRTLQARRDDLRGRIETAQKLEKTLEDELKVQNAILAQESKGRPKDDPYIARLEQEVAALQANLEQLREGSTQLARIDQRLSV
ncbi:glycine zipper domain-containing protein [Ectothiorhodospira sp. PHS-1]|uniref:glycine zipper domain-containing protein n=1 Tax=Ectothiorhodospira sp. PHS-1 TaxID=519989 RepID=UPI0005903F07|nr:glycine zipper domain-containing protein [Ectothiorhodospira sp. PHS-1]